MSINQQLNLNSKLNLKSVLLEALKGKLKASDFATLMLYESWTVICGDAIGRTTKPVSLNGTTLVIGVDNPAISFELGFIKNELINKINEFLKSNPDSDSANKVSHTTDASLLQSSESDYYSNSKTRIKNIRFVSR